MQILLNSKEILVEVNDGAKILDEILEYIKRYFTKYTILKTATILHNESSESDKRSEFIKWLCYKYSKHINFVSFAYLKIIQKNMNLPIRIKSVNHKYLVGKVIAKISSDKDFLKFETNLDNSLIKTYFKNYFKPIELEFKKESIGFCFLLKSSQIDIERFFNLIKKESILGMQVEFKYDENELRELFIDFEKFEYFEQIENLKYSQKLQSSYQLLNCHENMKMSEIKKRYIELVKIYHPDNVYNKDKEVIESFEKRFRTIQNAYEILKRRHKFKD